MDTPEELFLSNLKIIICWTSFRSLILANAKAKQIWLHFNTGQFSFFNQYFKFWNQCLKPKKTTSIFKWFGPSIQDLYQGWSVNFERVVYQKLLFGLIRLCRGHPEHSELTKMVENVQLLANLHDIMQGIIHMKLLKFFKKVWERMLDSRSWNGC